MAKIYAAKSPEISEREKRNMERSRRIAAQGMVLLENDGTLPLRNVGGNIALFGSGARCTIKGGTGAGDVNCRMTVNVEQGMKEAGFTVTTEEWMNRYDVQCESARGAYTEKYRAATAKKGEEAIMDALANPYQNPDEPRITEEDIRNSRADVAVYVLARSSGEGKDRSLDAGDYELSDNERYNLTKIAEAYERMVVVLNVGGVIDTKFIRSLKGAGAVLLMSQAGSAGGLALADILTGKETPSGHLASTWAENYSDYPCAGTFSYLNHDLDDEYYEEGIYVGYRYFDTFGISLAYPFGYGLSYTTFSIRPHCVAVADNRVKVLAEVKNTGSEFSGREVVQVYYSAPEGKLEKPYQELAGFIKTKKLCPGEVQTVEVAFPVASMASYDEERGAYILEPGEYVIRLGNSSRNTCVAAVLELDREVVTEELSNRISLDCSMTVLSAKGADHHSRTSEEAKKRDAKRIEMIAAEIPTKKAPSYSGLPAELPEGQEGKITLHMVMQGEADLDMLVGQLTVEEMADLCVGAARGGFGSASIIGAASAVCPGAAGDTTSALLDSRKVPNIVLADGPAGLRLSRSFVADGQDNPIPGLEESAVGVLELMPVAPKPERPADAVDYYQYCTAIPIATMLAQTWDMEAVEEAGSIVGEEMEEFGVSLWLAPGMNIHRNPLCGRNFEYYSEDPLMSGKCAAADTRGVQKYPGCGTVIKHFALNNQEDNRLHCNEHCTERAVREIYLKGFEIAVKESQPMAIMSSYNLVNGIHAANHYELLTSVCRDEWGFEGIVMTDWGTTGRGGLDSEAKTKYGCSGAAECIKAGNDLIMPGSQEDVDEIVRAVKDADSAECPLTKGELQACAKRILETVMKCSR